MTNCVFCQIARKEIPTKFIYEDEETMVFPDINPATSLHLLIVPKVHIEDFMSPQMANGRIWEKMTKIARDLIKKNNLRSYRLVINGGAAKLVNHLHLHLMGYISVERKL